MCGEVLVGFDVLSIVLIWQVLSCFHATALIPNLDDYWSWPDSEAEAAWEVFFIKCKFL